MNIELQDHQETLQLWRKLQDVYGASDAELATHAWLLCGHLTDDPTGKIFLPGNLDLLREHFHEKIAELDETSQKYIWELLMHIRAEKL